jgi:SOS-response transcriptional repressor LexA
MSEPLTAIQKETLDIIREGIRDGRPFSFREIAARRDVGVNAVHGTIKALRKKGYIRVEAGKSRGIRLTEPSPLERAIKLLKAGVGANPADIDAFLKETERHGCEVHGEGTTDAASSWQHDEARSRLR